MIAELVQGGTVARLYQQLPSWEVSLPEACPSYAAEEELILEPIEIRHIDQNHRARRHRSLPCRLLRSLQELVLPRCLLQSLLPRLLLTHWLLV